jgi:hypothetical protein
LKIFTPLAMASLLVSIVSAQSYDRVTIRDNEVVSVKFDQSINAKSTRRGDRFSATVDGDRYLPEGTKLRGRVADIRRKDGDRKAFADLEFTEIELPNGRRVDIEAYPVPLSDKYVRKDKSGRMEAKKETRRDHVVIGGTLGGLLIGSIFGKPMEGTIVGALAGILVAETDAMNTSGELIVEKGQKMGAAFDREVSIDSRDLDDRDYRDNRDDRDRRDDRDQRDERDDRSTLRIEYGDKSLRFQDAPYREGSTTMVPLQEMAQQLGLEVDRTDKGVFFVEDEENTAKLEQNRSEMRLNGQRINLPRAVVEKDGVTFVPIEAFAAIKKDSLYVNGTRVSSRT